MKFSLVHLRLLTVCSEPWQSGQWNMSGLDINIRITSRSWGLWLLNIDERLLMDQLRHGFRCHCIWPSDRLVGGPSRSQEHPAHTRYPGRPRLGSHSLVPVGECLKVRFTQSY